MAPKRNHELHHYVPQFYLRHWCDEKEQLWVISKNGRKPFRSGPRNLAAERGLYDTSRHPRLEQLDHEGILAQFEGMAASVSAKFSGQIEFLNTKIQLFSANSIYGGVYTKDFGKLKVYQYN